MNDSSPSKQSVGPCAGCEVPDAPWRTLVEMFYCDTCVDNDRRAEYEAQTRSSAKVECPACGDECCEEEPCGYCDNTGRVTKTQVREYRPLAPQECL